MSGADQHAAILGDQREDVAGRHDVPKSLVGSMATEMVCARSCAEMPVVTPSRASMETVKAVECARAVRPRHQLEMKLLGACGVERQADKAAAMLGHEIDGVRRCHLRRDDEVALVLPLLCIDQDEHAPIAGVLDDLLDGGQRRVMLGVAHDIHAVYRSCRYGAAGGRRRAMRST